jgi:outer membrane protein assembly factor BamB
MLWCMRRAKAEMLLLAAVSFVFVCKKTPIGHPPAAPGEPMGISNGGYNTTYEFSATATDPDTDSVAIRFSWGDGATSDWSEWVASGETARMSHAWSSANKYQVKAQAKDLPGLTSDWSASLPVAIIATRPPNTPGAPTGPSTAQKDSLCSFTTIAADPDGDGVSYRFDWSTGDTSAWTDWVPSGQPASTEYSFRRSGTFAVRAQARDVNEVLSGWSNSSQVTVPNPSPPSQPSTPSGPSFGELDSEYAFTSGAGEPDGDSVSIRFSWGDGDTSAWSQLVSPNEAVVMKHAWRDTGVFAISAQARDEYGKVSAWSNEWSFVTRNRPPDNPGTPQGPAECLRESTYAYSASTVDSDSDSVSLRFSWGDGDTSTWSEPVRSGQLVTSSHVWHDTGFYLVTAQAADEHGETSGWSDPCSLFVPLTKWRFATGFEVASSPAIGQDGTVYIGSRDGYAYAVNPNGTLKWNHRTGGLVFSSPAIAADGTVYIGSPDCHLYAINADGSLRWRYRTDGDAYGSPAISSDGTVYFGSLDSSIYAVNPDSTLKWRYRADGYVFSTSIADDGTVYAGSDDHYLYAINSDGTLKWRYLTGDGVYYSQGIAADGTVYFGSESGYFYALNADGTLKWRYLTGGPVGSSPVVAVDGTVYLGSNDCHLYALNADGTLRWRYLTDEKVACPAIAADGTVYVLSGTNMYAIGPDGTLKWRNPVGANGRVFLAPAIAPDGTIYVGAGNYLYAVTGNSPLASSPWPKFHHDNRNTGRAGGR